MGHYGKHDLAVGGCECEDCQSDKKEKSKLNNEIQDIATLKQLYLSQQNNTNNMRSYR